MSRIVRAGLAGIVAVAVLFAATQLASAITSSDANYVNGKCWANSAGNCYHWARAGSGLDPTRSPNGLSLRVENDVGSAWSTYFPRSLSDWSGDWTSPNSGQTVSFQLSGENLYATSSSCAGISGEVRVCSRKYGFNGWLGLASIWVSSDGEHITAGTVKLNDSYFNTSTYNTEAWRNLVSCQELAHTLGLNHEDETFNNANLGSCMDYTNDPDGGAGGAVNNDPSNERPGANDQATLANIYATGDSFSTVKSAPSGTTGRGNGAANGADIEDALPPGAGPQNGDVFERQLPDGSKIVTHVFWAERGRP